MPTKDEIQGCIWNAGQAISKYQKMIEDCNKKIDRLKPVYKELGQIKDTFKTEKNNLLGIFELKGIWVGDTYNSFAEAGEELSAKYANYYQLLDQAQDEVNCAIADLESKKTDIIPMIGQLKRQIVQWGADIENARN